MFLQSSLALVAQVLVLFWSATPADVCYVRPANYPLSSCPGQPCLTLHEYVEIDNFTNGTILQFLPGNHTLQQSLDLVNISNVTFEAAFNRSVTNIMCKDNVAIHCNRVTHLHIEGLSFVLSQKGDQSALQFRSCRFVTISDTVFQGSREITGRAIKLTSSEDITIYRCVIKDLTVAHNQNGGAIHNTGTNLNVHESSFINNVASTGGAIYVSHSNLLLNKTSFHGNSAEMHGGGIDCYSGTVEMVGTNMFHNNSCYDDACRGGAMLYYKSNLRMVHGTAEFKFNKAGFGGAISQTTTDTYLNGKVNMLKNKAVHDGGALYIELFFTFIAESTLLMLIENAAGNEGGALYASYGNVILHGNITIESNTAKIGGGIRADRSLLHVVGVSTLTRNYATYGGAMNTLYGEVSLRGPTYFTHSTAIEDGGALFADGTVIQSVEISNFSSNSAKYGGAMFFDNGASLNLTDSNPASFKSLLISSFNFAQQDGGVIYYRDTPSISQCSYANKLRIKKDNTKLPDCFLQFQHQYYSLGYPAVVSINDSAQGEGNFLFGGLMDRCRIRDTISTYYLNRGAISIYPDSKPTQREISSKPYSLCLCFFFCAAAQITQVQVYRGQSFSVPLLAKMQYGTTDTIITAITTSTARLETYQTSQSLPDHCTPLNYTVYSNKSREQVVLYPDGPCRDSGAARVVIDVTLLPCPDGFTQFGEICSCEGRLHDHPINCTIAGTPYFTKTAGSSFWMGVSYVNATYQGLVLCKSCPAEYCKNGAVNITIDNPDMQCDLNRTRLLCGACAANHSLMLGSSQCQVCPNTYLALLLPFAAAGVALVVFLTSLRLTVANGTLNSVILYANILQVKRSLFFPHNTINLLTIFLAWMNFDLGFQTCFYDGLNAYALTWLQFAFPLYVWLIICLMIFISRYSITVSKLLGSNPVAVLATLLLMSYTKILKIIIEVYSYENLDYPDNKIVPVWLKDANDPYMESKHLFLTVVTSLVLVFLFLPYTLLLLLGHKLYRFTGKKHWHWLNRLKPLLDSYYAPYKNHNRYWTGFLLLVRCALYIVFSVSSASNSRLTIMSTFAVIGFIIGYFRIYKSTLINLIEAFVYLNIILLSAFFSATMHTSLNTAALAYSLVGLVFAVMIALIAHQFHLLYIAKTALWLRLKNKWPRFRKVSSEVQISNHTINPSHDPHKLVTKTVIELREPLLDN